MKKLKFSAIETLVSDTLATSGLRVYGSEIGLIAYTPYLAALFPLDYEGPLALLNPGMYSECSIPRCDVRKGYAGIELRSIMGSGDLWQHAFNDMGDKRLEVTRFLYEKSQHHILRSFMGNDEQYWVTNDRLSIYGKSIEKLSHLSYDLVRMDALYKQRIVQSRYAIRVSSSGGVPELILLTNDL